jgi:hypothetical protein
MYWNLRFWLIFIATDLKDLSLVFVCTWQWRLKSWYYKYVIVISRKLTQKNKRHSHFYQQMLFCLNFCNLIHFQSNSLLAYHIYTLRQYILCNYRKDNIWRWQPSVTHIIYLRLKLSHCTPQRRLGERRYSPYSFSTSALDGGEWSASRHGRALSPGKGPPVTIVQEAGWAPEPVWTQRLTGKILLPLPAIEPR